MLKPLSKQAAIAGTVSLILARASMSAVPGYNIYPYPSVSNGSQTFAPSISTGGTYAASLVSPTQAYGYGVLYNISAGTTTVDTQTYVHAGGDPNHGALETYGAPFSVNNNGLMFGGSSTGNISGPYGVGNPTVWQNGAAYNLPTPYGSTNGKANSSNDLNQAVGEMKSSSAGADTAVYFEWHGPNSPLNNAFFLNQVTDPNNPTSTTLDTAWAMNNAGQIVGQANQVNLGAGRLPFFLSSPYADSATVIPGPTPAYNGGIAFAISDNGLVTGSYDVQYSQEVAFLYNSSSGTTIAIPGIAGAGSISGRGINASGEIVGRAGTAYSVPFLYDGTSTYDLQTLLTNNQSGAWHLDDNTSSSANSIADNGDIVGVGNYNGALTAFLMVPTGTTKASPQTLTFNNAGGTGNGTTWDTVQQNFNNGSAATTFSSTNGDYVSFTDVNHGNYNVSIPATVTPGSTTFNNSAGNYVISGAGGISGSGLFYKFGTGTLTINNVNTYSGPTNIDGGTVILGVNGAFPAATRLDIYGNGTSVVVQSLGAAYAMTILSVGISTGNTLDLTNNDLILHSQSLQNVNGELKLGYNGGGWNGSTGIISSSAGASHPLMALGAILNDNGLGTSTPFYGSGGTIAGTFGGSTPVDGDVLIKYTYYGDGNLDGKVDGSDYSLIDAAYLANQAYLTNNPTGTAYPKTGWLNGDFNYDGIIDGSDYTLMDNAYNSQGAVISSAVAASSTAQISEVGTSVPEPVSLGGLGMIGIGLLLRRRKVGRAGSISHAGLS